MGEWEAKYIQDDDAASYIGQPAGRPYGNSVRGGVQETPASVYRAIPDNALLSPAKSTNETRMRFNGVSEISRRSDTQKHTTIVEENIVEERKKTQTSSSIVRSNLLSMELGSRRSSDGKPLILETLVAEESESPNPKSNRRVATSLQPKPSAPLLAPAQDTSSPMKKSFRNIPGLTDREAEKYIREKERNLAKSQRDILLIQQIASEITAEKGNIIEKLEEAKSSRSIALKKKGDAPPPAAYPRPNFGDPSASPTLEPVSAAPAQKLSSKLNHQLSLTIKDSESPIKERTSFEVNRVATLAQSIVLPMEDSSPLIIPKERKMPLRANTFEIGLSRMPPGDISPHERVPDRPEHTVTVASGLMYSGLHKDYDTMRVQEKSYVVDSSSRPLMASPAATKSPEHQVFVSGFTSPGQNINLINQPVTVNIRGSMPATITTPLQASQSLQTMLPNPGQIMWPTSVGGSKLNPSTQIVPSRADSKPDVSSEYHTQFSMLKSSSAGFYNSQTGANLVYPNASAATRSVEFVLQTPGKSAYRLRQFDNKDLPELASCNWTKWARLLDILHQQQPSSGWGMSTSIDVDEMLNTVSKEFFALKTQYAELKSHAEVLNREKEYLTKRLVMAESHSGHPRGQDHGLGQSPINTFATHSVIRTTNRLASPNGYPNDSTNGLRFLPERPLGPLNTSYYSSNHPGMQKTSGVYAMQGARNFTESLQREAHLHAGPNQFGPHTGRAVSSSVTESTAQNLLRRNYSSYLNPADRLNIASMMRKGQLGANPQFSKSNAVLLKPDNVFVRHNSGAQHLERLVTTESEDASRATTHFIYEIHNGKHQLRRNQSIKDRTADCCLDHNHTHNHTDGDIEEEGDRERSFIGARRDLSANRTPQRLPGQSSASRSPGPVGENSNSKPVNDSIRTEELRPMPPETLPVSVPTKEAVKIAAAANKSGQTKALASPNASAAQKAGVSAVFARLSNLASNPTAGKKGLYSYESTTTKHMVSGYTKPPAFSSVASSSIKAASRPTKLQSNQHLFAAMTKDVSSQRRTGLNGVGPASNRPNDGTTNLPTSSHVDG